MSKETQELVDENTISENNQVQESVNKTIDLSSLSMEELITELENLCGIQNPYSVSKKSEEIKTLFYKLLKSVSKTRVYPRKATQCMTAPYHWLRTLDSDRFHCECPQKVL